MTEVLVSRYGLSCQGLLIFSLAQALLRCCRTTKEAFDKRDSDGIHGVDTQELRDALMGAIHFPMDPN